MSTITSSASAIDVPSLVSQLMSLERQPIDKLNEKIASYQTKISSFGTISSLVSGFQSALQTLNTNLQKYSASPSDASYFSASTDSTAVSGTHSLNVTQLAQAQSLVAVGQTSDTIGITSAASTVTFTVGTTSTNISIGAGATLQDIRAAINASNIGVSATIVNDGSGTSPFRLALSSTNTGLSNAVSSITIQTGGDSNLNSLLAYNPTLNAPSPAPATPMTQAIAAKDANLTVNGIAITSASNTITGAIQGVTLTLNKITATPATLTVTRDTNSINTAASSFVDTYNALVNQLKSRSAYGTTGSAAPSLAGDGSIRLMLDQLRGILNSPATPGSGGTLTTLYQVGISYQADGTLKLDGSKLGSEMIKNFSDVANLFSSATGFATRLNTWSSSVLSSSGLISTRTTSISNSIKSYNDQIEKLEARMKILKKQYTTTYTNLNGFLSSMSNTSAYLTSQYSKGA